MITWRSEVTQPCPTLCDPMGCSLPGSSVHGILQARVLEWVAISFSRGSSRPRDWTGVSHVTGRLLNVWAARKVPCRYGCVGGGGVSRGCLCGSAFQSSRGLWALAAGPSPWGSASLVTPPSLPPTPWWRNLSQDPYHLRLHLRLQESSQTLPRKTCWFLSRDITRGRSGAFLTPHPEFNAHHWTVMILTVCGACWLRPPPSSPSWDSCSHPSGLVSHTHAVVRSRSS